MSLCFGAWIVEFCVSGELSGCGPWGQHWSNVKMAKDYVKKEERTVKYEMDEGGKGVRA